MILLNHRLKNRSRLSRLKDDGYTLLEVVIVVVLFGLMATAIIPAFVRSALQDPLTQTVRLVRDAERFARHSAIGTGAAFLYHEGAMVTVIHDTITERLPLPNDCTITCQSTNNEPASMLWIDRYGRSADIKIVIAVGTREHLFHIHGLSGAWEMVSP